MSKRQNCYCAFCRQPRRVYVQRDVSLLETVLLAIPVVGLELFFFGRLSWIAAALWATFVLILELFLRLRWRLSLVCRHCGFDPIVYKRRPETAANQIRRHLERRKNDPLTVMKRPLALHHVRSKTAVPERLDSKLPPARSPETSGAKGPPAIDSQKRRELPSAP